MKRYAFTLVLFSLIFAGCSSDDIDPDLSKEFVGTWVGEVLVEDGYQTRTDWTISRISDTGIKINSKYTFTATDPQYTSSTTETVIDNVTLSKTVANSVTMNTMEEIQVPGDVISVKGVGIVKERR